MSFSINTIASEISSVSVSWRIGRGQIEEIITVTDNRLQAIATEVDNNIEITEAASASGAIAIDVKAKTVFITKGSIAALTLVDPTTTTHDGYEITFISTTAFAHTLDNSAGSGFNNGGSGSDVGTFGGAIGDGLTIKAYQGIWYVMPGTNLNVTLA